MQHQVAPAVTSRHGMESILRLATEVVDKRTVIGNNDVW
jgi:hypothetical protein